MNPTRTQAADLLAAYDQAIRELDAALGDAASARLALGDIEGSLNVLEAQATLDAVGTNAEQRKAAATLALRDNPDWQDLSQRARDARAGLLDAERRAAVSKERCRFLRAALGEADGRA